MREASLEIVTILAAVALLSVAAALFALVLATHWAKQAHKWIWRLPADWHERRRERLSRERK